MPADQLDLFAERAPVVQTSVTTPPTVATNPTDRPTIIREGLAIACDGCGYSSSELFADTTGDVAKLFCPRCR